MKTDITAWRRVLAGYAVLGVLCLAGSHPAMVWAAESQDVSVQQTGQGVTINAEASRQRDTEVTAESSNAGENDMGGTELEGGQTLKDWEGNVLNESDSAKGEYGEASYTFYAGASGQVQYGENGVEASGQVGFQAELEALAHYEAGDENFGGGAQGEARVQALLQATGKIGAYIDSKGLTIGADAKAEALVSAQASISMNVTLFGISTTVLATGTASAGASASAAATVTIGFDGKLLFKLGAGAAAAVGGKLSFEFEVNTAEFMEQMGIPDLASLVDWCQQFSGNPDQLAKDLANEAGKRAGGLLAQKAKAEVSEWAGAAANGVVGLVGDVGASLPALPGGLGGGLGSGLQSLFSTGSGSHGPGASGIGGGPGSGSGGGSASGSPGLGGGGGGGGGSGSGVSDGKEYKRDSQYKKWSR